MVNQTLLKDLKKECLVFDIETSAFFPDGREINLRTQYDDYIKYAQVKWVGIYSYKYNKQYYINCVENKREAVNLLKEHSILVGFNNEDFDYPIIVNNEFTSRFVRYENVDCMQILGPATKKNRQGYSYKNRGTWMKYRFRNCKLRDMAKTMGLQTQKGDIDYDIFKKNIWSDDEIIEIKKYLSSDIMATKEMFDIIWSFWLPFTELLYEKHVKYLSWIRSSIATLTYNSACYFINEEPTYSDKKGEKEKMGGRVIIPKCEEATNVFYVDASSLYPHIYCMFGLFAEKDPLKDNNLWHGNDVFKVKGYYDISKQHKLSIAVKNRLLKRDALKKTDPKNPMIYALKIFLNSLYGINRTPKFEKVYTPNSGWDCCYLGQQINILGEQILNNLGFEIIQSDTDSWFIVARDKKNSNIVYVKECLQKIIDKINKNVPFPIETFKIDIEAKIEYLMCPFSLQPIVDEDTRKILNNRMIDGYEEKLNDKKKKIIIDNKTGKTVKIGNSWVKERFGKKKNYMYIHEKDGDMDVQLVGLPIKKDNATFLGIKIYDEVLKPKILETMSAKFDKKFIDDTLEEYLKRPEIMDLISREYKVNPADTYKKDNGIQAQISNGYFDGESGIIKLIKNNKIGSAGKAYKYCTIKEAIDNNLTIKDIDLEKIYNELAPFIKYVPKKVDK